MPITINGTTGIAGVDGSAATPALQGTDTNTGISFGSDVIIGSTGGVERWRTTPSGQWLVGTSTATANGGVLQVSNGITFPATQSACSDANTLDDYEEGTFTPTLPAGSTGVTYTAQLGVYTKIGNVVYFYAYVQISAVTSVPGGAGGTVIDGLPFTSRSTSLLYPKLATAWNGCNFGGTVACCQVTPNTTVISALASTNNAGFVDSTPSSVWDAGGNWLAVHGHYYI